MLWRTARHQPLFDVCIHVADLHTFTHEMGGSSKMVLDRFVFCKMKTEDRELVLPQLIPVLCSLPRGVSSETKTHYW